MVKRRPGRLDIILFGDQLGVALLERSIKLAVRLLRACSVQWCALAVEHLGSTALHASGRGLATGTESRK